MINPVLISIVIKLLTFELDIFIYFKEVFSVKARAALLVVVGIICSFFTYLSRLDAGEFIVDYDQYLIINAILVFAFYLLQGRKESDFVPMLLLFLVGNLFYNFFFNRLFLGFLGVIRIEELFLSLNLLFQIGLAFFLRKKLKRVLSSFFKSRRRVVLASLPLILIACFWIIPDNIIPTKSSLVITGKKIDDKLLKQKGFDSNLYTISRQITDKLGRVFLIFSIFLIVMTGYLVYEAKRNRDRKRLINEKNMMEEYINTLEKTQVDIRKVQHDYKNMLMGISGFIHEDTANVPELKQFLEKNQLIQDSNEIKTATINQLKKINIPAIKGLVSTKVIESVQKGIDTVVECNEEINIKKVDPFDLSRALGIILDNAIEECENGENQVIKIAFISEDHRIMVIVTNTCTNSPLNLAVGESTKGKGRGFGLQNLREIISSSNHLSLETSCNNGVFSQKISIQK